jgi:hypothetical protein
MAIGTRVFVHDTASISIKRCLADEKVEHSRDSWDITITDDKGETVVMYCFGDKAVLTADLTGEGVCTN